MNKLVDLFFRYSPNLVFVPAYNLIMSPRRHISIKRNPTEPGWLIIGADADDVTLISPTPKFFNVKGKLFADSFDRFFKIMPGDTVLDVGACIGDTTVFMAIRTGSTGTTIAVEPDPTNCSYLRKNLARFAHTEVYEVAAYNSQTTISLHTHFTPTGHSLQPDPVRKGLVTVRTDTIDNIIGKRHIDFAKIDVQGSELEVLEGAKNLLKTTPKLMVETHFRDVPAKRTYPKVIEVLQSYGYKTELTMDNGIVYATKPSK